MNDNEEPGSDKVTACTRAFEEIDAQVFPDRPGGHAIRGGRERFGGKGLPRDRGCGPPHDRGRGQARTRRGRSAPRRITVGH